MSKERREIIPGDVNCLIRSINSLARRCDPVAPQLGADFEAARVSQFVSVGNLYSAGVLLPQGVVRTDEMLVKNFIHDIIANTPVGAVIRRHYMGGVDYKLVDDASLVRSYLRNGDGVLLRIPGHIAHIGLHATPDKFISHSDIYEGKNCLIDASSVREIATFGAGYNAVVFRK